MTCTQPVCTFCGSPLRFDIQPCKLPQNYKKFVTDTSKTTQSTLQQTQGQLIGQQHNDYQTKKS